jgi:hypothetical protein
VPVGSDDHDDHHDIELHVGRLDEHDEHEHEHSQLDDGAATVPQAIVPATVFATRAEVGEEGLGIRHGQRRLDQASVEVGRDEVAWFGWGAVCVESDVFVGVAGCGAVGCPEFFY